LAKGFAVLRFPKKGRFSVRRAVLNVIAIVQIAGSADREPFIDDGDLPPQGQTPVNSNPGFVRCAIRQTKPFCPSPGRAKIADK
jgi:hypothetical protein